MSNTIHAKYWIIHVIFPNDFSEEIQNFLNNYMEGSGSATIK